MDNFAYDRQHEDETKEVHNVTNGDSASLSNQNTAPGQLTASNETDDDEEEVENSISDGDEEDAEIEVSKQNASVDKKVEFDSNLDFEENPRNEPPTNKTDRKLSFAATPQIRIENADEEDGKRDDDTMFDVAQGSMIDISLAADDYMERETDSRDEYVEKAKTIIKTSQSINTEKRKADKPRKTIEERDIHPPFPADERVLSTFDAHGNLVRKAEKNTALGSRSDYFEINLAQDDGNKYDLYRAKQQENNNDQFDDVRKLSGNREPRGSFFVYNDLYIRKYWDGRLKVIEFVASLLATVVLPTSYQYYHTRYIFHRFVCATCFVFVTIDLFFNLCSVVDHIPKFFKSQALLLFLSAIGALSLLTSSCLIIVIADVNEDETLSLLSSLCGFICMVLFGVDCLLHVLRLRSEVPLQGRSGYF